MWPIEAPNGWLIRGMARDGQSQHVRKHLLNLPEHWEEICSLSRTEIRAHRAKVEAAGCACGPEAAADDAPGSMGHRVALDLFVRDYEPVAFLALCEAFEAKHAARCFEDEERSIFVVTDDGLVVVAAGREVLRWRTAYRITRDERRRARPEVIHRRHQRAARNAVALSRPDGGEKK